MTSRNSGGYENDLLTYLNTHSNALPPDLQQQVVNAQLDINQQTNLLGTHALDLSAWSSLSPNTDGMASNIHVNSNTICHSGGDTSSCTQ